MNDRVLFFKFASLCILLCLFSCSLSAQKKGKKGKDSTLVKIDSTKIVLSQALGVPIAPFRDTLFLIHGGLGSFTVQERAKSIENNIKDLANYTSFSPDSLQLVAQGDQINLIYTDIGYKHTKIIESVDTLQAQIYGRSKLDLAKVYRKIILSAVLQQQDETSFKRIGIRVLSVILLVAAELFLIWLIGRLHRRLKIFIRKHREKSIKGILGIIDAGKEVQIIFFIINILRLFLVFASFYISVLVLLNIFPNTSSLSGRLLDYVLIPLRLVFQSVVDYLPKLIIIIVIIVLFLYLKKFLRTITNKIGEGKIVFKGFYPDWAQPTYNIVTAILSVFTFILIFPYLPNSNSQVFQGVSVFVGLIISLGSTNLIGNLIAGLIITYMRPFKVGDRVRMDDTVGNIIEKTALVTRIRTPKNEIMTIPNSTVMNTKTVNYTFSADEYGLILFIDITIGYDVPWRKVHELLMKVADITNDTSKTQKPFILQTALDDSYVGYQLNVYTKEPNKMIAIYSDLRKNAQDVFNEAGVEILSPRYIVARNKYDSDSSTSDIRNQPK